MGRRTRGMRARATVILAAATVVLAGVAIVSGIVGFGGAGATSARAASPPTPALPAGFQDTVALSGLDAPTAVRFSPDGRIFVAEEAGVVKEYDSLTDPTPTTVVDLSADVNSFGDRGILGMTLDPGFPSKPYLYLLYTRDAPPAGTVLPYWDGTGAPYWNDACPPASDPNNPLLEAEYGCVVSGKLVRITVGTNSTMVGAQTLIQDQWCQQFTSHSIGDLQFGADGMLYASSGEGSNFEAADWGQFSTDVPNSTDTVSNPCGDPPEPVGTPDAKPTAEGGALRAQSPRRTDGPAVLSGTVIRVDPATGAGVPGNPYYSSSDPNKQRIVAYGLRNPFRFTFRPGTNELWIGDVGLITWEEIDRDTNVGVAANYGWPCYEGPDVETTFNFADANLCSSLTQDQTVAPYYVYQHKVSVVPGDGCKTSSSSISGVSFYDSAQGNYPYAYHGSLFFTDHSRNCIWVMPRGADGLPDPTNVATFVTSAGHPVDLQTGPGGDLFYVDIDDGQVHRITYTPPAVGSCPAGSYDAQYFNNTQLSGQPTLERCDQNVGGWGASGPDPSINPDNFSVRYSGSFDFSAGEYQFTATATDGIRVLVDGSPVIDEFIDEPATTYQATTQLSAGAHQITVEYYHRSGSAQASVGWQPFTSTSTSTTTSSSTTTFGSTTTSSSTTTSTTSTPPPKPTPKPVQLAKLAFPSVLSVHGHTATFRLRCVGSQRCTGSLLIQRRVAVIRKHRRVYVTVTLASGRISIPANATRSVTVTLSSLGRETFAKKGSLGAWATVTLSGQRAHSVRITAKR